ncbi:MAG: radical SAM protein [Candidatus Bathyarchaeia archaeon]
MRKGASASGAARVVLTADRTLMSEYAGNIFFGFFATAPRGLIPAEDWLYFHFLCPSVPVDKRSGAPLRAPAGLRRIEAKLLASGFSREEVAVAHPDYLHKAVGSETRVIGITEFDPLGIGPVTSTYTRLLGGEGSYNAYKFRELMEKRIPRRDGLRVIVGGPGAWQLVDERVQREFGIDTTVLGEAENVVGPLFKDAVDGKPLPRVVQGTPVALEDMANIVAPTIHGLVEVARGCGRGCDFCNPTLTRLKCRSIPDILKEVKVNVRSGLSHVTLHAEDIFRYRANGVRPDPEAVEELFRAVCNVEGVRRVYVSHGAFASVLCAPAMLRGLSETMNLGKGNWRSYQVGLETGSPRLVEKHMAGKCKPFKPEEWPEVVEQATGVSNDAYWLPCSTLIMGLPGETPDDVAKTIELIDDLKGYWAMFYPLFFIPLGHLSQADSFTEEKMLPEHFELLLRCWEINLRLWPNLFRDLSEGLRYNFAERAFAKLALNRITSFSLRAVDDIRSRLREGKPFKIGKHPYLNPSGRTISNLLEARPTRP